MTNDGWVDEKSAGWVDEQPNTDIIGRIKQIPSNALKGFMASGPKEEGIDLKEIDKLPLDEQIGYYLGSTGYAVPAGAAGMTMLQGGLNSIPQVAALNARGSMAGKLAKGVLSKPINLASQKAKDLFIISNAPKGKEYLNGLSRVRAAILPKLAGFAGIPEEKLAIAMKNPKLFTAVPTDVTKLKEFYGSHKDYIAREFAKHVEYEGEKLGQIVARSATKRIDIKPALNAIRDYERELNKYGMTKVGDEASDALEIIKQDIRNTGGLVGKVHDLKNVVWERSAGAFKNPNVEKIVKNARIKALAAANKSIGDIVPGYKNTNEGLQFLHESLEKLKMGTGPIGRTLEKFGESGGTEKLTSQLGQREGRQLWGEIGKKIKPVGASLGQIGEVENLEDIRRAFRPSKPIASAIPFSAFAPTPLKTAAQTAQTVGTTARLLGGAMTRTQELGELLKKAGPTIRQFGSYAEKQPWTGGLVLKSLLQTGDLFK